VRKIRSPQTQGEEGDLGTSFFHKTCEAGPIFRGGLESWATPEALGPRNCGQDALSSAAIHGHGSSRRAANSTFLDE